MKQKLTKQSPSSRRRWPAVLLTLICCLAVLAVTLLSPIWFNVWADKLNNRTVHVSSIADEPAALSCAQRLDVYQSYRQTSVYNLDTTNVSESEAILEASLKEVEVLHQITGLPCFDLDVVSWARATPGFSYDTGKVPPGHNYLFDNSTGYGAAGWEFMLFPDGDNSRGIDLHFDQESGQIVEYIYYTQDQDFFMAPNFVRNLAGGLAKYWHMDVLDVQEMEGESSSSLSPGGILFEDAQGNQVVVVVIGDYLGLSINAYEPEETVLKFPGCLK